MLAAQWSLCSMTTNHYAPWPLITDQWSLCSLTNDHYAHWPLITMLTDHVEWTGDLRLGTLRGGAGQQVVDVDERAAVGWHELAQLVQCPHPLVGTWTGKRTLDNTQYCIFSLSSISDEHPIKTPVGVLPMTCWSEGKQPSRQTGWHRKPHKWLVLGRSGVLRSSRHYLQVQSQGHHTINHLEEGGVERGRTRWKEGELDNLSWKDEKGQSPIRQTLEPLHQGHIGKTSERQGGMHRYHPELNWTAEHADSLRQLSWAQVAREAARQYIYAYTCSTLIFFSKFPFCCLWNSSIIVYGLFQVHRYHPELNWNDEHDDSLRQLSWAQAAREAARRGMIPRSIVFSSLKSSRHVTRSMEGRDRMVRSDSMSSGAAAGMMG